MEWTVHLLVLCPNLRSVSIVTSPRSLPVQIITLPVRHFSVRVVILSISAIKNSACLDTSHWTLQCVSKDFLMSHQVAVMDRKSGKVEVKCQEIWQLPLLSKVVPIGTPKCGAFFESQAISTFTKPHFDVGKYLEGWGGYPDVASGL